MDFQLAIKVLNSTATKYIVNHDEDNILDLHRQLDVFIGLTKSSQAKNLTELESASIFLAECVPKMIDILLQPITRLETSKKILTLIQNIMHSSVLRNELRDTIQLTSIISNFIHQNKDGVIEQCLDILQQLTYNIVISHSERYLEDLIGFLMKTIQTSSVEDLVQPCLTIVTNMCRKNTVVQKIIRNKADIKLFYRRLLGMTDISGSDLLSITALSALTSLAMNDDMGSKFFSANNLGYTLELVQNSIVNKNSAIQGFAIDLFMDLMAVERIQQHFLRCKHFESSVSTFFCLLEGTKDPKQVSKIFEMLLTLCSVGTIRRAMVPIILKWEGRDDEHPCDMMSVTTKWIGSADGEDQPDTQLNALRYVGQLLKDPALLQGTNINQIEQLVWTISQNLSMPYQPSPINATKLCEIMVEEFSVLLKLCENKNYSNKIGEILNSKSCTKLVDSLLNYEDTDTWMNLKRRSRLLHTPDPEVSHAIVCALTLMVKIKNSNNGMEEKLYGYLQEPGFMKVLAESLVSVSEDCVQKTLDLICLGTRLPHFPQLRLSRCIVTTNVHQKSRCRSSDQVLPESSVAIGNRLSAESGPTATGESCETDESRMGINNLIEKIEKGLQVSDIKQSSIMEMYEHKVQSLLMKEKHLQDLLDAKSRDLQQADRCMAQYRSRWAQSDAEALNLRNLLCESEKRSETAKEETTKNILLHKELQAKHLSLTENAYRLDQKIEELVNQIYEQQNQISALQENNGCLKKEHVSLMERNNVLEEYNSTYRQKVEEMTAKIGKLDAERKTLLKQLKERDLKLAELNKTLANYKNRAQHSDQENITLKDKLAEIEDTLAQIENDRKLKLNEIAGLESRCTEYEMNVQTLKADRDKYRDITKTIFSMSAGVQQI